ncbi:MAG: ribose-5-phosphate isomerase RpiA, partial [Pseudomonadota bacterium]
MRAVDQVVDGMRVGLGTGSTAAWMVRILGQRIRDDDLKISCVATSDQTVKLAEKVGLQVVSLNEARWLDLTIDGADEFDEELNLIKGGGGALLREKVVASASDRVIVIADGAKEVKNLGSFPLPVEVLTFGWEITKAIIEESLINLDVMTRDAALRMNGHEPFITDEGNYVVS